jgi:hypothetical protein
MVPFCKTQLLATEDAQLCSHLKDKKKLTLVSLTMFHVKLVAGTSNGSEVFPYLYWLLSFQT